MAEPLPIQLVVPMSGVGDRFRRAGFSVPKPLIPVDGRPMIAHVLALYPGATDVLFICNTEHLADPGVRLEETLRGLCPTGRIAAIAPHKLGPVHALAQCWAEIDPGRPVVVSYCDFGCVWDYAHFQTFVREADCDGCIPCYRGFHPHLLRSVSFAYVREEGGWGREIREKAPFTDRPHEEWASSGTYYFASGALLRRACEEALRRELTVGGEYYVSLAYQPLFEAGSRVAVYPLGHFMQWGTPEDLADYAYWSDTFRLLAAPRPRPAVQPGTVLMPMAGHGARFAEEGYLQPKPLVPVSGRPMVLQAVADLPRPDRYHFVRRRDLPGDPDLAACLAEVGPAQATTLLSGATDGQARSCLHAMASIDPSAPLTIASCDSGALYDPTAFERLLADPTVDLIVWTVAGYPPAARRPTAYGWVRQEEGQVLGVSVKEPLEHPESDPVIIGTFTFRRAADFSRAVERLVARDARVHGELYVDSVVEDALALGMRCVCHPVDRYLGWGSPEELRTFSYWQSAFDRWPSHPYAFAADPRVDAAFRDEMARREMPWRPEPPRRPA